MQLLKNLKPNFTKKQIIAFVLVFAILGGSALLYKIWSARGANYSWFQTDWSGGASTTALATHANNQTGWTNYYSKDALLSTSTPGQLSLSSQTASTTDTATANFTAGSFSNTYATSGAVYLKKPNGVACTASEQCTGGCCISSLCVTAQVGNTCGGGIVFATASSTGTSYTYVSRTADDSTGAMWGCYGTAIGAGAQDNNNGKNNTAAILAGCSTSGIAARVCTGLSSGSYTDWYLPATNQLVTMYNYRTLIGGFTTNSYWSSTEYSGNPTLYAWYENFYNGAQNDTSKSSTNYVRCIRSY